MVLTAEGFDAAVGRELVTRDGGRRLQKYTKTLLYKGGNQLELCKDWKG